MNNKLLFFFICLSNVIISFNTASVAAVIPTIALDLGQTNLEVARIISCYLVPYGFGALLCAPLTRKYSYRRILFYSMFFYAISNAWCGLSSTLGSLYVARVGMGVTAASFIPLGLMMIGDFYGKKIRGRLIGMFFSCSFFAALAGIVVAGLFDWRLLFLIPAALAALMSVLYVVTPIVQMDKVHGQLVSYQKIFSIAPMRHVFLMIAALSFLYHGVHKWYGVYLSQEYQMDKLSISFFFVVGAVGGLVGQLIGGVISDKKSRLAACLVGVGGLGLSTMGLAGHYSYFLLGCVLFLISIFWTIGHNGFSTVLTDFPEEYRPAIASLNSSVRFISGGLGFYISGFLVQRSFPLTFLTIGILIVLLISIIKYIIPNNN